MSGFIDNNLLMNFSRHAGEIIRGAELLSTLRSVKYMASLFVSDGAGALSIERVASMRCIFFMGNRDGLKN